MNTIDYNLFYTRNEAGDEYMPSKYFEHFRERTYQKGEYIAMKGDKVRELSIVVEGSIRVEFVIESGLVIRSILHNPPSLIGAVAIMSNNGRYMADTVANENVRVISYTREQIEQALTNNIHFARNFISFISSRIESMSLHIALLAHKSIKSKVAFYIFTCSKGGEYTFDKKIGELAEYLSVERPSLSRVIGQMVEERFITYHRGKGEILNERRLKELIE